MRHRPAFRIITAVCLGVLCAALVCGCGPKTVVGATAQETADNFAAALDAGRLELAATAFDYVSEARRLNPDWDDIPGGQRDLIVQKLIQERAGNLGQYVQRLGSGIKAGPVAQGVSSLTGDSGSLSIELRESEDKWYIYNVW
jgi:hypothetical protein